ncbi:MAG: 30S ribosomal protein S12 methylthiotransferase RimO [Paludibacteraceae bacterium]|nr:30S ribosomal protein S12 methylthiotransferase RimO [Paludibacteraceae bacterium]
MHKGEIDFITLGCSKNLVDAERVMRQLEAAGWHCVHDAEEPKGEICVINTCGFIGDAKEESINMILRMAERKKQGKLRKLIVMGCLSERYRAELEKELPEVDEMYGKFDFLKLADELKVESLTLKEAGKSKADSCSSFERKLTTPRHYAYLKISEGCDRFCSYCAIPLITGRHTSRPQAEILDEVRWLVSQGVKELNVIAQDLSSYGLDLSPTLPSREGEKSKVERKHLLPELIDEIAQVPGVEWIRLHYAYPTDFPEELLDVMARHQNVCKYLDIALQHCTDHMLGLMRRHITRAEQDALIQKIREKVPGICIRTTLLVGHPGETEEDFEALKAWVKEMRFERMGCFAYSDEEGTYAHRQYTDDIPTEVKEARAAELMAIQQDISRELMQGFVGKTEKVIIDREEGEYFIGRTQYDSPEVDCEVLIEKPKVESQKSKVESQKPKDKSLKEGEFYDVLITRAEEFDLYGELRN